jgi:hypothetical protein
MAAKASVKRDHHGDPVTTTRYSALGETQRDTESTTWADISPRTVGLFIAAVVAAGDAVMFTATRQGGVGVTILCGDERTKLYSNDAGNMEAKLGKATDLALASVPPMERDRIIEQQRGF